MYRRTALSVFVAAALAFGLATCDFNPTAPFAGFDGEQGATLNGQFRQSGTATGQRTLGSTEMGQRTLATASDAEAVTEVNVYEYEEGGNMIGSVDVEGGTFTLRGLPETFFLEFLDANGDPVKGKRMKFDGVKPNQEIDIVVAMVRGRVVLIEEKRTGIDHEGGRGVELEGTAQNIVIDFPNEDLMTGSLYVGLEHVFTRAGETSIRKGNRSLTLEDLDPGDQVHVRGVYEGADVFAYEIKLQEEVEEGDTSQESCSIEENRDPKKPNHILICHKGKTLSISPDAWPGHRAHGDTCGPCE